MAAITFGGLASGLDTNGIITALMNVEKLPLNALQTRQNTVDSAKTALTGFSGKLTALQTAANALGDSASFSGVNATSSDATSVVATSAGTASQGSYDVTVTKVAKEHKIYSGTQATDTGALAGLGGVGGTLTLAVGSATALNITVDATESLASLASKINASGARVSASVVYTGSAYQMQLRGLDTAKTVTLGGDANVTNALGATTYQAAQQAQFTVDGITMKRDTNQITDAVPGLTLALVKEGTSATVKVAGDSSGIKAKIQTFVNAYNDVVSSGQLNTGHGTIKASNAMLSGDSSIRSALSGLANKVTSDVAGTSGLYTTMASVGISTTREGRLSFDESKLSKALQADPVAVSKLFVTDTATSATGLMKPIADLAKSWTQAGGLIQNRVDMFDSQSRQITKDMDRMNARLAQTEDALRKQYTRLELEVSKYKSMSGSLSSLDTNYYSR